MKVFRIAKTQYIHSLDGVGASLYGGRWNLKGTYMVYAAENRSLAALEFLVNLSVPWVPPDCSIIEIEIPNKLVETLDLSQLPADWRSNPAPEALARLGSAWAHAMKSLALRVPSAVIPKEWNLLLNPLYPHFTQHIRVSIPEVFTYDTRLIAPG